MAPDSVLSDTDGAQLAKPSTVAFTYESTVLTQWAPAVNGETGSVEGRLVPTTAVGERHAYYPLELGLQAIHYGQRSPFRPAVSATSTTSSRRSPTVSTSDSTEWQTVYAAPRIAHWGSSSSPMSGGTVHFQSITSWESARRTT